ncbi:zinc-dependent alcohol dehydrogenase family protein [Kosakonia sp. BK9b]
MGSMVNSAVVYRRFGEPLMTLQYEHSELGSLAAGNIRVKMRFAPVNASDLIPVTGAYRHRITLPATAGYEGVGVVTEASGDAVALLGQRVLPLRGQGTWQQYVDCPAAFAVAVPTDIDDSLAARAWINPMAALLMLQHFPPAGKQVVVTAAGSDCAGFLAQWARLSGATRVTGIYRSAIHADRLAANGITPLADTATDAIEQTARDAEVVYDATGGALAALLLSAMPRHGQFVSYGLLSGQPFILRQGQPAVHWFHIRNYLDTLPAAAWQQAFGTIWARLRHSPCAGVSLFGLPQWQDAVRFYQTAGRTTRPVLAMD